MEPRSQAQGLQLQRLFLEQPNCAGACGAAIVILASTELNSQLAEEGQNVLDEIEKSGSRDGKVKEEVKITDAGEAI